MDNLPREIIVHIFQYLTKHEQIKASSVNKKFREILFCPSLWTECDKKLEIDYSKLNSFRKFVKETPALRFLNFQVKGFRYTTPTVYLTNVFKPLKMLECLSLQLNGCKLGKKTRFPSTLKHITLIDCELSMSFINNNILCGIASQCPELEHIEIKSPSYFHLYDRIGLNILLTMSEDTLKTLILSVVLFDESPVFYFCDCPNYITTLFLQVSFDDIIENRINYRKNRIWFKFPNLENLQILFFEDTSEHTGHKEIARFFMNCTLQNLRFLGIVIKKRNDFEDFYEKFAKLPNLQVLYLDCFDIDIGSVMRFVKGCSSLKVLAWNAKKGYTEKELFELKKLKKETPLKIYLKFTDESENDVRNFPSFPNEHFENLKIFTNIFDEIFSVFAPNFYNCHSPLIKKFKSLFDI